MNIDSNLVIITVHKGPTKDLIKTLKSIDSQILKPKLNIVVVRNISFYEIKLFRNKKRILIQKAATLKVLKYILALK